MDAEVAVHWVAGSAGNFTHRFAPPLTFVTRFDALEQFSEHALQFAATNAQVDRDYKRFIAPHVIEIIWTVNSFDGQV
jgi:hypothetical protein